MPAIRLLPVAELLRLTHEANALLLRGADLSRGLSGGGNADMELSMRLRVAGASTMHFVFAAAALAGDGELLAPLASLLQTHRATGGVDDGVAWELSRSLGPLVAAIGIASPVVEAFARDRSPWLRLAVAEHLPTTTQHARDVLRTLAADPDREVRREARERLRDVEAIAWWRGWFEQDPTAHMDEAHAPHVRTLQEACEALDARHARRSDVLPSLFRRLPVDWALALLERLFTTKELWHDGLQDVRDVVFQLPGTPATLARLARKLDQADVPLLRRVLDSAWKNEPPAARAERCLALVAADRTLSATEGAERKGGGSIIGAVAAGLWPPSIDAMRFLDAVVLGLAPGETLENPLLHALWTDFRWSELRFDEGIPRLLEARLAGYPGAWSFLHSELDSVLARLDWATLEPWVDRACASNGLDVRRWGAECLVARAKTRAEAGEDGLQLLGELLSDKVLRQALTGSWLLELVGALRVELRAGRLSFEEAARAFELIHQVYGGAGETGDGDAEQQAEQRRELHALLGPPSLQGPPTDEEWALWRALRDAELAKNPGTVWSTGWRVFPSGPLGPADLPFAEHVLDLAIANVNDPETMPDLALVGELLETWPSIEILPWFDRMERAVTDDRRDVVAEYRREVRAKLGLPAIDGSATLLARRPKLSVIEGGGPEAAE